MNGLRCAAVAVCLLALQAESWAAAEARLLPRDAGRLQTGRNLLSNGSFEAVAEGRPQSWETIGAPTPFGAVTEVGLHGKTAALVDTPGLVEAPPAGLRQEVPANPQCTYELHGWLRVLEDRGGSVALAWAALDVRGRPLGQGEALLPEAGSHWTSLAVTFQPPPQSAWLVVTAPRVRGGMRVLVDAVSLEIVRGPRRPDGGPDVEGLLVREVGSNWALLAWASVHGDLQVRYRAAGSRAWETVPAQPDGHCTLLSLKPATRYDYFVEPVPKPHYDASGRAGDPPWRTRNSGPRALHTAPWEAREWDGLRLWPTQPLRTVAGSPSFPAVEAYEGALYVTECVGGGIHLSRLQPDTLEVEWSRQIIAPPAPPDTLAGLLDTCLSGARLHLTYNIQAGGSGAEGLAGARQLLAVYDLGQEKLLAQPLVLPTVQSGASTYGAALTTVDQRVWVTWVETWLEDGERRSRALIGDLDRLASGDPPTPWDEAAPNRFWGPGLAAFEGQPLLLGSDLAPAGGPPEAEPLVCVRTDGTAFHGQRTLVPMGRNRYPRGIQVGEALYLLYRTDVAYPTYRGRYQDVMLAVVESGGMSVTATAYVGDMTFSTWPDVTAIGSTLYVVYQKLSHVYGDPELPAQAYGTYIGRIETGPVISAAAGQP